MGEGSGRKSGLVTDQTSCRQSRVGSTFRRVGSGPRKVTRGQLWYISRHLFTFSFAACIPSWTAVYQAGFFYGLLQPARKNLSSCQSACLMDLQCVGISWNATGSSCYVCKNPANGIPYKIGYVAYTLNRCTTYAGIYIILIIHLYRCYLMPTFISALITDPSRRYRPGGFSPRTISPKK